MVILFTALSILAIGEDVSVNTLVLLFLAYYLMQLEIAAVTFGISAFLHRGSLGLGLGLSVLFYFINIVSNLTENAKFLKYITPFVYTEGADIITNGAINKDYLLIGIFFIMVSIFLAFWYYSKKDIT